MASASICIIIAIVIYLAGMLFIGAFYSKSNKSSEDFYLGGRKLGPLVTAMSTEASDMSAYLLMGLPGLAYFCGLAEVSWTAIGLALGTYLNWLIVAKKLRVYSHKINAITVPDFFGKRFNDKSGAIEGVAALIILIFFVPYVASIFVSCGKLFVAIFNTNYFVTMLISAIVIVTYTSMGGFMAASVTSLVQSIVMTVALIIVLIFGVRVSGGWGAVMDNAKSIPAYLSLVKSTDIISQGEGSFGFIPIVSTLAWGLGYFGMPHVLLHFMAVEKKESLPLCRRVGTIWVVISMGVAVLVGIVGFAMTKAGAIGLLETSSDAEAIIVKISELLSQYGILPALLAGIILAGILAASMSTADAQLIASASAVTENLLGNVFHVKLDSDKNMKIARLAVIGIAIIGFFFALNPDGNIFRIVSFAWGGFGATFGPIMLFSLFWKRTNRQGVISGMVAGAAMIFIWKYGVRPLGGAWDIYELLPAFIVNCIFVVIVSLATAEPEKEITDVFDSVSAEI